MWENEAAARGYIDEFSVTPAQRDAMPIQWRLAYIARLLRSARMLYNGLIDDTLQPRHGGRSRRSTLRRAQASASTEWLNW